MPVNYRATTKQGQRLRPGELRRVRVVTRLYPFVDVAPTAEEIEYYRSLKDYALVADRQSDGKELGRLDATGQWGRFNAVRNLAQSHGLYLPEPKENLGRKEGEPMFLYDKRHYFVDGEGKDASGLVGHPLVRPELWRLGNYCEVLYELGCAPSAVLIGSAERWFRNDQQFNMWYQALKVSGVRLIVHGLGEVTDQNNLIVRMCVEANSQWLGPRNKNARAAKRERGEAFQGIPRFGFTYPLNEVGRKIKNRCVVIPDEWATMRTLAFKIDNGEITTAQQAGAWLYHEHESLGRPKRRRPCSVSFVRRWFASRIPEGWYPCHGTETEVCRVKLEGTKLMDVDVTPNGGIRRLLHKKEPIHIPIHVPEELAIPADVLQGVRQQLLGRKAPKKKKIEQPYDGISLFPSYLVRCAHCGSFVVERPPKKTGERDYVESSKEQDELAARLKGEGKSLSQIAAAVSDQIRRETGRAYEVSPCRVRKRLKALGVNGGSPEENLRQVEAFYADPFRRRHHSWHLYCYCSSVLSMMKNPTDEDRRRLDPKSHVTKRAGSLTLSAWPVLWKAVMGHPPLEEDPEGQLDEQAAAIERERLEQEITRLQSEIDAINRAWWAGEFGDPQSEEAKRQRDSLRKSYVDDKNAKAGRRDALAAQIIKQKEDRITAAQFEEIRELMRQLNEEDAHIFTDEKRQEFIETFVRQVTLDLETGEWEMETEFHWDDLRRLAGKLGLPTEHLMRPAMVLTSALNDGGVPKVPESTTSRCCTPWSLRVTARGRLVLA